MRAREGEMRMREGEIDEINKREIGIGEREGEAREWEGVMR